MKKKWYHKISSICNGIISIVLAFIMSGCSWSLAWFSDNTQIDLNTAVDHGSVLTQYFESGNGTQESPYEIKYPLQLYYFSWLQNLGFFNEDADKDGSADTVYFYLSDDIDMTNYTLPPIGTAQYPFIGNFDGKGKVISNLIVNNSESSMTNKPEAGSLAGVQIVGFFGIVGNIEGGTQYSYDTEANEVKNVILDSVTVKTESNKALIGIAVGYMNGNVQGVGVIDCKVNISANTTALSLTSNLSDYSVVGYCTDNFKDEVIFVNTDVSTPHVSQYITVKDNTTDGEGQGWGGSIAMDQMFTRLQNIMNNSATKNTSYVYARTDVENATGQIVTASRELTEKKVYANADIGSFVFSPRRSNNNNTYNTQFTYLSGGITVTKYTYSYGEETPAYYIEDEGNYLRLNGTNLQNTTDSSLATKWIFEDGALYAENNGVSYYLMANRTTLSAVEMHATSSPTSWRYTNNQLSYTSGGTTYYLMFQNGAWRLSTENTEVIGHRISFGNNYLTVSGNAISNTTTEANASVWVFSNGTSGTASTTVNGTTYYLSYNNGIALSQNNQDAVSWTYTNNNYSCRVGNTTYYLVCNGGLWELKTSMLYTISSSSNYLSVDGTSIDNATSGNAVGWSLSNGTSGGTISTVINGTTYYLSYNDGLGLTTNSSEATSWTYNNNRLSFRSGNTTRYLRYNNDWTTATRQNQASTITLTPKALMTNEVDALIEMEMEETVAQALTYETSEFKENELQNGYYNNGAFTPTGAGITYFPLSTNNDYTVKESNTGYVVGGSYSTTTSDEYPYGTGDIRVSWYNRSSVTNITQPRTMTYKSSTGFATISDTNESTMKNLGLEKYADCYENFQTSVESRLNGLHFMESTININSLVTIPKATINGAEHTNYQLPTNCIDFHLTEQGFVNFFAGTYFSNNNSFFSLHKIERDANEKIIAIKEIEYIYGQLDANGNLVHSPYYYKYVGEAAPALPKGYDIIFDMDWIKSPSGVGNGDNKLYYFEVPVNAGEYALGSAGEDKIGAYLIYLDLAANAQTLNRTQTIEKITTEKSSISMPTGVAILETKEESVNPLNNAFVTIAGGYGSAGGEISFKKAGENITQSANSNNVKASYVGEGITLLDGIGNKMIPPNTALTVIETTVVERITWKDFNISTQQEELTVVTTRKTVTNTQGTNATVEVTVGGESANSGGYCA